MMTKWVGALLGVLFFFSCGELPEIKPSDWDKRQDFSGRRFPPSETGWWDKVSSDELDAVSPSAVQNIKKNERWKGSGKFSSGVPVYYIFKAAVSVKVTIDWEYRREDGIDFAYKKVGVTIDTDNYGTVGQNEYLVMRISPPAGFSGATGKTDWEIGFTVN
ncbi:MAG: hypothetical protein LBG27_14635 [Spirochaetaceae bacterium]|jgi:hypothetical protein|nr:hypothetical protein [Spirochaetaceae bacterium]